MSNRIYVKVGNNQSQTFVEALASRGFTPLWHDGADFKIPRNLGFAEGPIVVKPWEQSTIGGPADYGWWEIFADRVKRVRELGANDVAYDFEPGLVTWPHNVVPDGTGLKLILELPAPVIWRGTGRLFANPCGATIDKELASLSKTSSRIVRVEDLIGPNWALGTQGGIIIHSYAGQTSPEKFYADTVESGLYNCDLWFQEANKHPIDGPHWASIFDACSTIQRARLWQQSISF